MSMLQLLRWVRFRQFMSNGVLTVMERTDEDLPFWIDRLFTITGVTAGIRANHAHRTCRQCLVCIQGQVGLSADDGTSESTALLTANGEGMLVEPMVWIKLTFDSPETVLLVLCDSLFDPAEYISDRAEFDRLTAASRR